MWAEFHTNWVHVDLLPLADGFKFEYQDGDGNIKRAEIEKCQDGEYRIKGASIYDIVRWRQFYEKTH